jgi:isopentenyl-diphosphate delta-isomerase
LPDEEVSHAARRRLQEELGLDVPLAYAGVFTYRAEVGEDCIEHEIDHVFYGYLDADAPIYFNQSEVASMQWWPIAKLDQLPSPITPWFASAWALVEKAL